MSKRGKQARALRKQQKQINKIQKRLAQAGIRLDLETTNQNQNNSYYLQTKRKLASLKKYKRELKTSAKETKTKNTNKITDKQLRTAIEKKKQNIARYKKPAQPYIPTGEALEERKITNLRDKLRKNIAPQYMPPKSEQSHEDKINTDTSFFVDSVIQSWFNEIHHFPRMAEPILKQWYDEISARYTKEDIATMLEEGARAGVVLTYEIAYDGEKLAMYMSDMLDFYPEMTPWEKAEILEQFESWEDLL